MTTSNLTIHQRGIYTVSTGTWGDAVFGIVPLGAGVQAWVQVDKTTPLVSALTALTMTVTSDFAESGTLTILAFRDAVTADFFTGDIVPSPTRVATSSTATVSFVVGSNALNLPLVDSDGKATLLHGEMRSRRRAHSNGTHYFAVGLGWEGTGGNLLIPTVSATYVNEFTGLGGVRGTAGVDRAVRCPRCGNVVKEADLVADGFTRTPVCSRCYDPAPEPSAFQWPFRNS